MENLIYDRDITTESYKEGEGYGWRLRSVVELTEEVNGYAVFRTDIDQGAEELDERRVVRWFNGKGPWSRREAIEFAVELVGKIKIAARVVDD